MENYMMTACNNISFIENGNLQYNLIVYPDNLQEFYKEMTEEIRRQKVSTENSTAFAQFIKYSLYRIIPR